MRFATNLCDWSDQVPALLGYTTDYRALRAIERAVVHAQRCWCQRCQWVHDELWTLARTTHTFKHGPR